MALRATLGRRTHGLASLGLACLVVFLTVALTPVANRLNEWMAGVPELEPSDAIVVLGRGGADADGLLTNRSLRRVLRAVDLYRDGLAAIVVFSGSPEETRARSSLARGMGVAASAIIGVPDARTTREEVDAIRAALGPRGGRRILLVADPIDMPRGRALMERAGFVVRPAPTASPGPSQPEARLGLMRDVVMELSAWIYYRLAGAL